MPPPPLIEIIPLPEPVSTEITVPGSKSITNRALILGALSGGLTILRGALWSEDTQVMVESLRHLGFSVEVAPDPAEACNRTIMVQGRHGQIPCGGTTDQPLELFVGNAGTAARFLAALVCLGPGVCRLRGVDRMHDRPQAALFQALRDLGYRVDSMNDRLPVTIHGGGSRSGACRVSIEASSQFASALLLSAGAGGWQIEVAGENAEESPYVGMTLELIKSFPRHGGDFLIEPDASSGSYFWAAGWLWPMEPVAAGPISFYPSRANSSFAESARCRVRHWPRSHWQIDSQFPRFLPLPASLSRQSQLGDSIMTAMVLAPFGTAPVRFTDLGRLRLQECERVQAMRTELSRCGATVREEGDTLLITPSALHGAEIETYQDHRMAMCFAILGLKTPGIKIKNPACVKKTFPNFFLKLSAPPPQGLGVTILDATTRRPLHPDELFAD